MIRNLLFIFRIVLPLQIGLHKCAHSQTWSLYSPKFVVVWSTDLYHSLEQLNVLLIYLAPFFLTAPLVCVSSSNEWIAECKKLTSHRSVFVRVKWKASSVREDYVANSLGSLNLKSHLLSVNLKIPDVFCWEKLIGNSKIISSKRPVDSKSCLI